MKMSEYAAQENEKYNVIEVTAMVSPQTLVGEQIEIVDLAKIENTKYGRPCYKVKIADGTGFFTSSSLTRQIDDYVKNGVPLSEIKGCVFTVIKKHMDADPKTGKAACDFLKLVFVEDTKDEVAEVTE